MNFYSANGNLIKKNVESFQQTQNNNFIQIKSSQTSNNNTANTLAKQIEKTEESIRNSMIKDCKTSLEEARELTNVVLDDNNPNPNVEISSTFINVGNTNNDPNFEKKLYYERSISAFGIDDDVRNSCLLEKMMKFNKELKCFDENGFSCKEKECKAAGYTSCINKKEEEKKADDKKKLKEEEKKEEKKEAGLMDKIKASGISNNLIIIIGLLVLLYLLFNKNN